MTETQRSGLVYLLDNVFPHDAPDTAYLPVGDGGERLTAGECRALARKIERVQG